MKFLVENQPNEKRLSKEHLLWDKKSIIDPMERNCRVSMRDYMSDPEVSKKVLESLHVYGVAFIEGVQANQQNTEFVIRQLFPIHKTFFGEMWTFSDKQDHSDTAYTNSKYFFREINLICSLICWFFSLSGGSQRQHLLQ